jgi:hypothetical protein
MPWGAKAKDRQPRGDLGCSQMPTASSITPAREFAAAIHQRAAALKCAAPN